MALSPYARARQTLHNVRASVDWKEQRQWKPWIKRAVFVLLALVAIETTGWHSFGILNFVDEHTQWLQQHPRYVQIASVVQSRVVAPVKSLVAGTRAKSDERAQLGAEAAASQKQLRELLGDSTRRDTTLNSAESPY